MKANTTLRIPNYAKLIIRNNEEYPVDIVHFETGQVTLQESHKVFNTVSIDKVIFNFEGFSKTEIIRFKNEFFK